MLGHFLFFIMLTGYYFIAMFIIKHIKKYLVLSGRIPSDNNWESHGCLDLIIFSVCLGIIPVIAFWFWCGFLLKNIHWFIGG